MFTLLTRLFMAQVLSQITLARRPRPTVPGARAPRARQRLRMRCRLLGGSGPVANVGRAIGYFRAGQVCSPAQTPQTLAKIGEDQLVPHLLRVRTLGT